MNPHMSRPAAQARDRRFQAVLPLRGKILNVERNTDAAMYKNEEIAALIVALGLGLKGEAVPALRYGKARPPRARAARFLQGRLRRARRARWAGLGKSVLR